MERNKDGMFDLAIEVSFKIGYQVANYNDAIFDEAAIKKAAIEAGFAAGMKEAKRQLAENRQDGTIPSDWRVEYGPEEPQ